MEKRTIEITLEQAREWYKSGDKTLKKLALTTYTEEELTISYPDIESAIGDKLAVIATAFPVDEIGKHTVNAKLAIIAAYLNGNWKRSSLNKGYYIGKSSGGFDPERVIDYHNNIGICVHQTIIGAGIVYFKDVETTLRAYNMLTELDKSLLLAD